MRGTPLSRWGGTVGPHRWSRQGASGLLALLVGTLLGACGAGVNRDGLAVEVAGGEPARGVSLIRAYGCNDCHTIPGVRGADTMVGPPLTHWSRRVYIAGLVPNTPENLVRWIHNPHLIHPQSAMPNMGVPVDHARHIAAYLYTIR